MPEKTIPIEEQLARRQSAPKPTIAQAAQMAAQNAKPPMDGFKALKQVIGEKQVQNATLTLQKYKQGKANLEQRIIENEQWYKLRHWECMRKGKENAVEPVSSWLFNAIANKHADAMDNYPMPNVLPREESDKGEAKMLSSVLPVVLEQNDFEEVYDNVWDYKLKSGTGVYGIFWDKEKLNGLGDISIRKISLLSLFWEPGITDIQKSRHLFHVELQDNDLLEEAYPQLRGKLGQASVDVSKYIYDDSVDTTAKSAVVDWYYKKKQNGRIVLHYCKYVNDEVLFATENEDAFAERGWYDHGKYPFEFDPMFSVEGTPCGFGIVDLAKSAQEYIDRGNQAIMQNMLANARPRHFIRDDGEVNEAEYADTTKDFVHVGGNLGQDSIRPIEGKTLDGTYLEVVSRKIEELKEVTGNRDASTGGTTGGVTSASGLAAQIEAGAKLSRDSIKASYRSFRRICLQVIELMRQFYDRPRTFRILGEYGTQEYLSYSNAGIVAQAQGNVMGVDTGARVPLFDITVTAQKQSPYTKQNQNDLAIQFFGAGFFNPQMSDQALACLDMMDFDRKDMVMQTISRNGTMYQQLLQTQQMLLQLAQIVDSQNGSNMADMVASQITGAPMPAQTPVQQKDTAEPGITRKARQMVAESTAPV